MCSTDHNKILHMSRQCYCRDMCKLLLWLAKYFMNKSITKFSLNFEFKRNIISEMAIRPQLAITFLPRSNTTALPKLYNNITKLYYLSQCHNDITPNGFLQCMMSLLHINIYWTISSWDLTVPWGKSLMLYIPGPVNNLCFSHAATRLLWENFTIVFLSYIVFPDAIMIWYLWAVAVYDVPIPYKYILDCIIIIPKYAIRKILYAVPGISSQLRFSLAATKLHCQLYTIVLPSCIVFSDAIMI